MEEDNRRLAMFSLIAGEVHSHRSSRSGVARLRGTELSQLAALFANAVVARQGGGVQLFAGDVQAEVPDAAHGGEVAELDFDDALSALPVPPSGSS